MCVCMRVYVCVCVQHGSTPLKKAAKCGGVEICTLLIMAGAVVDKTTYVCSMHTHTFAHPQCTHPHLHAPTRSHSRIHTHTHPYTQPNSFVFCLCMCYVLFLFVCVCVRVYVQQKSVSMQYRIDPDILKSINSGQY